MSDTVGPLLRATREAKGQTLEDVERVIRIRAKHLAALEADDFAELPSSAHARGFLKNYAQHLGLDAAAVLAAYEAQGQKRSLLPRLKPPAPRIIQSPAPRARSAPARPKTGAPAAASAAGAARGGFQRRPPPVRVRPPRLLSADVLVAVIITLALGALLYWGAQQLATGVGAGTATAALGGLPVAGTLDPAAATAAALLVTPTERPSATPTGLPPTPAVAYSGVNLTVSAEQRAWVSVRVDGIETFAGILPPGETRDFVGLSVVEVTTGNGQGTRVVFNGVDQGLLGELGEVVIRLWTEGGMQTPTPTAEG